MSLALKETFFKMDEILQTPESVEEIKKYARMSNEEDGLQSKNEPPNSQKALIHLLMGPKVTESYDIPMRTGCTACVMSIDETNKKLYIANAGDSRVVMCQAGKAEAMSKDHKPDLESEKIRIYKEKEFEDATSTEKLISFVDKALDPFKPKLLREVRREDIEKLLEIKAKRFAKFQSKEAEEQLKALADKLKTNKYNIEHLVDYTISWFEHLKEKYGNKYPRRTEVRNFASINLKTVVEANQKLYINREEGFIGTLLKKNDYLFDCSDIDDIIIFYRDGKYKIVKVADKIFIGTNTIHIAVFKKNDSRTIYNVVYRDGKAGVYYMKRFAITGLARDKEYDLTQGKPGSKVVYFTANPNGEAEIIRVVLKPALRLKNLEVCKDLSELAVKNRNSRGNLLTKYDVKAITLKQKGASTLGGRQVWFDPDVLRINYDGQGTYLGEFTSDDKVLVITNNGDYYTTSFELTAHFDNNILKIEKYNAQKVWSLALWDADQKYYYAKRFVLEANNKAQNFVGENSESYIVLLSDRENPMFKVYFKDENREPLEVEVSEFIGIKGAKAKGKRLTTYEVDKIEDITPQPVEEELTDEQSNNLSDEQNADSQDSQTNSTNDIEMTINAPVPESSLPVVDDQLSLF